MEYTILSQVVAEVDYATWPQAVVQIVITLGSVVLGWFAFEKWKAEQRIEQAKVVAKVTNVEKQVIDKTDTVIAQNDAQGVAIGRMEIKINGRVDAFLEKTEKMSALKEAAALKYGIQLGILEERARQEKKEAGLLAAAAEVAEMKIANAGVRADQKLVLAEDVALRLVEAAKTEQK